MINNRLITSKSVIAKIISDLQLQENEIKISDIKEWICEGLLKIGAIQQYEHKVTILPVKCHQASLPCDLYKLGQVAFVIGAPGKTVSPPDLRIRLARIDVRLVQLPQQA